MVLIQTCFFQDQVECDRFVQLSCFVLCVICCGIMNITEVIFVYGHLCLDSVYCYQ